MKQQYLIIITHPTSGVNRAYYIDDYDYDRDYNGYYSMIIIDLANDAISYNGKSWKPINY
jgi:hypothetical protein